jgi:3',5'-cyclic-AMP phosphodiesterase
VTVVVQLSDPHIGADWGVGDPDAALERAVADAAVLRPDAVIVSGDIVEHGTDREYERARELLAAAGAPVHVLPGNHDDRAGLRRHFGLPGAGAERVTYAAEAGPLRLLMLDSTIPGQDAGELGAEQLAWLGGELSASDAPAIVALHHPPLTTGVPAWDKMGLAEQDRAALAVLLARSRGPCRVVAGHLHRAMTGASGGSAVVVAPSVYVQGRFDLRSDDFALAPEEPVGFAVHVLAGGELASHVVPVMARRTS